MGERKLANGFELVIFPAAVFVVWEVSRLLMRFACNRPPLVGPGLVASGAMAAVDKSGTRERARWAAKFSIASNGTILV